MVIEFSTPVILGIVSTVICTLALFSSVGILFRLKGCLMGCFALFSLSILFIDVAIITILFYNLQYLSSELALKIVQVVISIAVLLILIGAHKAVRRLSLVPDSLLNRVCIKTRK